MANKMKAVSPRLRIRPTSSNFMAADLQCTVTILL